MFKAERCLRWIVPCQKAMQYGAEAIDICLRSSLRFSILFRCGISWRPKGYGISGLTRLKVAGNAKINQVEVPCGGSHDISWFKITENDGWFLRVQVVEDV